MRKSVGSKKSERNWMDIQNRCHSHEGDSDAYALYGALLSPFGIDSERDKSTKARHREQLLVWHLGRRIRAKRATKTHPLHVPCLMIYEDLTVFLLEQEGHLGCDLEELLQIDSRVD
jgi:hypothetical protein